MLEDRETMELISIIEMMQKKIDSNSKHTDRLISIISGLSETQGKILEVLKRIT